MFQRHKRGPNIILMELMAWITCNLDFAELFVSLYDLLCGGVFVCYDGTGKLFLYQCLGLMKAFFVILNNEL